MDADLRGPASPPRTPGRITRLDLAFLVAVLLLGIINLPQPFHWDQAMFSLGARKLHMGGVLYRDFWDVKQPGIYGFYLLGGWLFGFSEVDTHAFELLYLMLFSVVLVWTLKDYFRQAWVTGLAALLTVGYFYACTGDWHMTQVEGLAGFPIFLALWYATRACGAEHRGAVFLFLSGVMGGIALLFKLGFLLIVGSFWLVALIVRMRAASGVSPARAAKDAAWIALGVLVPILPVVVYFAAHRALGLALWTWFRYPVQLLVGVHDSRFRVLLSGVYWFGTRWASLLGLAFLGAFLSLRRSRDLLSLNLVLWIATGLAVILVQRWSWWQYQYLLLSVPVGILAARGIDQLVAAVAPSGILLGRWEARVALAGTLLLFCPLAAGKAAHKSVILARHGFAFRAEDRGRYQRRMSTGGYATIQAEVAFLSAPGARPGSLFVVGSPLYNWLSGRAQGVPRGGGVVAPIATPEDWARRAQDVAGIRPPYIFLQKGYADFLERTPDRYAAFLGLLASDYAVMRRDSAGVWYERRPETERGR